MSATPTPVTAEHLLYLAERTASEDDYLRALKSAAQALGMPAIWISPEQASFMQILLRLAGARTVVEVGTLAGYSAIAMARALPSGGRVHTIEIDPERAAFAAEWADRSDVAGKVFVHVGAGNDVLPRFATGEADAAFLDADKPGYASYLEQCLRIVRSGGLILVDNAFAFGRLFERDSDDADVRAVQEFNETMARERRLQSIIVPIGDGLWVGVKR